MLPHWLDKVAEVLIADTKDLRQLAKVAGYDATTFYLGTNMHGADIRGQNLTGMQFTDLELSEVQTDNDTKFDIDPLGDLSEREIKNIAKELILKGELVPEHLASRIGILRLGASGFNDPSLLANFYGLKTLTFPRTRTRNLSGIESLKQLSYLNLSKTFKHESH